MVETVIVGAARTPMGAFQGELSSFSATELGAIAIKGTLKSANIKPYHVDELLMGCVLPAGLRQAPARQAGILPNLPKTVPAVTVNKVCGSGMKTIIMACDQIKAGSSGVVIAGGMESMSNAPYISDATRAGKRLGHTGLNDHMFTDGLEDAFQTNKLMGHFAEDCATKYQFTREDQDDFAIQSYKKASDAIKSGLFKNEIVHVNVPQRKGDDIVITEDEEYKNVKLEKLPKLKPVFSTNGTVTAANASTLNDGASAVILMSSEKANELNLIPLAKIISYADASQDPKWFTTSPAKAVHKALKKSNLNTQDIDYWELNEAFSVVGIVNTKLLKLDPNKVDVNGGAVALGHPLGSSGSRIVITLINVLKQNGGKIGVAGICNGGGGASALIIENIN